MTTFPCTQKQRQQFHWGTEKAAYIQSAFASIMIPRGEWTYLNMRLFFFSVLPCPSFLASVHQRRVILWYRQCSI